MSEAAKYLLLAHKAVLEAVEERDAKLLTIASTLVRHLAPESVEAYSCDDYAWRLCQILEDNLASNGHQNTLQTLLLGGAYATTSNQIQEGAPC